MNIPLTSQGLCNMDVGEHWWVANEGIRDEGSGILRSIWIERSLEGPTHNLKDHLGLPPNVSVGQTLRK